MINLYSFTKLQKTVEESFGIEVDPEGGDFKAEQKVYRLEEHDIDKVTFEGGDIFFKDGDDEYKGFLVIERNYKRAFPDRVLGEPSYLPKFHTTLCEKLDEMKRRGRFNGVYIFSNQVIKRGDSEDGVSGPIKDLRVCGYCKNEDPKINDYLFTKDFVENHLDSDENANSFRRHELPKQYEKDEWGYVNGWDEISLRYRAKKGYICEKCDLNLSRNKYYLEVHHINSTKTDNKESNLQCLCTGCHAHIDQYHRDNFYNKPKNREKLREFRKLYPNRKNNKD